MCTVGTEWKSLSSEPGVTFTRIMPDAARLGDRLRLLDAGVAAAVADHDLARDLGRVERAEEAQRRLGRRRAGRGDVTGVHDRTRHRLAERARETDAPTALKPLGSVTVPS